MASNPVGATLASGKTIQKNSGDVAASWASLTGMLTNSFPATTSYFLQTAQIVSQLQIGKTFSFPHGGSFD